MRLQGHGDARCPNHLSAAIISEQMRTTCARDCTKAIKTHKQQTCFTNLKISRGRIALFVFLVTNKCVHNYGFCYGCIACITFTVIFFFNLPVYSLLLRMKVFRL